MDFTIRQELLCSWIWDNIEKDKKKVDVLIDKIRGEYNYDENQLEQIKNKLLNNFLPSYNRKWNIATRNKFTFVRLFKRFLSNPFIVRLVSISHTQCTINSASSLNELHNSSSNKRGRPRIAYHEGSDKTKKRRVHELLEKYTDEELTRAADSISINQPVSEKKIEHTERDINGPLAMYMDLEMTRDKYEKLRMYNEDLYGDKLYPSYENIREAKKNCYPKNINVTENGASVKLQSLLDHTVHRIFLTFDKEMLHALNTTELVLYGKWGMDGASSQQATRQQWSEQKKTSVNNRSNDSDDNAASNDNNAYDEENLSDRAVFIISFVPIHLVANNFIVWLNKLPSSTRYCRPVKFEFVKESAMNTLNEYKFYDQEIEKLATTHITIENRTYQVTYNLKCTMIDGKTCNVLTGQKSSSSCNVCNVNPSKINNLSFIRSLPCDENSYKFGLSTLHCWIRFMECLLHIAYNLDFKKSYALKDNKILKQRRKQMIQKSLKSKLSITVDVVKQGYGTTNTGNVARCFFSHPQIVAEVTGLEENLIIRFKDILQALASGCEIDCIKFKEYCTQTVELYLQFYSWYNMPPSVHKVLIHGDEIIRALGVPIGSLSEEAQEATNKVFKNARANNSRMCSRKASNEDIMHHLLISSDPLISSIRIKRDKKSTELSEGAKSLLINYKER